MIWNNSFNDERVLMKAILEDFYDKVVNIQLAAYMLSSDTEGVQGIHPAVLAVVDEIDTVHEQVYSLLSSIKAPVEGAQANA